MKINHGTFLICYKSWCSIKDDYRTLVGLKDVDVVETYAGFDENEDDV